MTWVILELTPLGEAKVEDGTLEGSLRQDLGVDSEFPIFIPSTTYTKDGKTYSVTLMEGYAFLSSGLGDVVYFGLEKKPYINQVMSSNSGPHAIRTISTISDLRMENLKLQLRVKLSSKIRTGEWVEVISGSHRTLEGEVTGIEDGNAYVRIELRSLKLIATIPLVFLEVAEKPIEEID